MHCNDKAKHWMQLVDTLCKKMRCNAVCKKNVKRKMILLASFFLIFCSSRFIIYLSFLCAVQRVHIIETIYHCNSLLMFLIYFLSFLLMMSFLQQFFFLQFREKTFYKQRNYLVTYEASLLAIWKGTTTFHLTRNANPGWF